MTSDGPIPFTQIIKALLDTDTPFHARYLHSFSDIQSEELELLEASWSDIPTWRRQALMEDIEELGVRDTLLSFEAFGRFALQDRDPGVRTLAIQTLCEFDTRDLAPIFINLLGSDQDPAVRAAAASTLGRFVMNGELDRVPGRLQRKVEDNLLQTIKNGETPIERQRAIEALAYSSSVDIGPVIENAYESDDLEWIVCAVKAMGHSANEKWAGNILAMLDSKFPQIRSAAARAAGELEIQKSFPTVVELLDDPDDDVRINAIFAISQIGGEGVHEILEEMYERTEETSELERINEALDYLEFWAGLVTLPLLEVAGDEETDSDRLNQIEDEDGRD